MIDNLDDNDGRIIMANGRQGPWHSFNDSNGGNQPAPVRHGLPPAAGGANNTATPCTPRAAATQFGGVGFDLNNSTTMPESMQSQAYNASAYNGITFWAKGNGTLRVEFADAIVRARPTAAARAPAAAGTSTAQHTPALTGNWTQITIPFSCHAARAGRHQPRPSTRRR